MRLAVPWALAAALVGCATAQWTPAAQAAYFGEIPGPPTAEQLAAAELLTSPILEARPTGPDYEVAYPPSAISSRASGSASLDCIVLPDHRLACSALDDGAPHDFERASLLLSTRFRLAPTDGEGRATAGRRYRLRIAFRIAS